MTVKIIQAEHPALRKKSLPIPESEIKGGDCEWLIRSMNEALGAAPDGVALAAPQIGVNQRLFVVSHLIIPKAGKKNSVFINPRLIRAARRKVTMEEGCLSVRDWYGLTRRSERVTIAAWDETGRPFVHNASGLLAQIFQHEIDHLDGILFTDQARNLHRVRNEKTA